MKGAIVGNTHYAPLIQQIPYHHFPTNKQT